METKNDDFCFVVSDYSELRVMHRVFREAKFCLGPDDLEVSESVRVSDLFCRLMAALISAQERREGPVARSKWESWLAIDETRDEWHAAMLRAKAKNEWREWDFKRKSEYVSVLLSPFLLSEEKLSSFIAGVDAA